MLPSNEAVMSHDRAVWPEATPTLFSELVDFGQFIREELNPFPGRGQAVVRFVVAAIVTVIISQTLRIPNPAISAYLVFFVVSEDGVSSFRMGLAVLAGLTVALAAAMGVTICFMDALWFRLPATFLLIAGAVWLSRTMVLVVLGRIIAVILALYLSLADVIFEPEALTEAVLWLWPTVALPVGVTVLVNFLLEPKPDLLLRAQMIASLEAVERLLENLVEGRGDVSSGAKPLRRLIYAAPQRMRWLLARWRQRRWPAQALDIDWELAVAVTERLITIVAARAAAGEVLPDDQSRTAWMQVRETIRRLVDAIHNRDRETVRNLHLPATDDLPDSLDKTAIVEIVSALSDCHRVLLPTAERNSLPLEADAPPSKPGLFLPDALTNPEYARFTVKTVLAILACEVFMNAVAWPGIRTCLITCVVTALATAGAQRQKQLLRLTGACAGGVMGLAAVLYVIPQLDSIVGLSLLLAAGTAACAWVAAGSVRSSYAGFQMALAFYIVLLPNFSTNIDLTGIRDRFVGILVGITAMWIIFNHLWHTSSRRQVLNKLVDLLRLMAKSPATVSPEKSPVQARSDVTAFRRQIYGELAAARLYLDETKIELTLALTPKPVRGSQLEIMAREVSFAAFLLLAINERKWQALASSRTADTTFQAADDALARFFTQLADTGQESLDAALNAIKPNSIEVAPSRPSPERSGLIPVDSIRPEFRLLYETLDGCITRMADLHWIVRALP